MAGTMTTFPGAPGPAGPAGPEGPEGPQGPIGPQGPQGIQGETGPAGAQGPEGPQGPQGDPGATGATGAQGPQGIQGVQGPQGDPGAAGADGDRYQTTSSTSLTIATGTQTLTVETGLDYSVTQSVTIAYDIDDHMHGEVVSYNAGTGVLVVDVTTISGSGTFSAWVVNLSGAVGAVGPAGPAGPQGPQGVQGEQGIQGIQGVQGETGPQGDVGPAGPQGIQGETGPAGPQGPTGPQGPQGDPGPGTIAGTIAANEVAFGTATDTIGGDARLTYDSAQNVLTLDSGVGANGIIVQDTVAVATSDVQAGQLVLMGGGGITGATLSGLSGYLRLEADVGGAGDIPTIQAWDESDTPTTLELTVGGLTVNNSAGTAGQVLTSAGAGAAPTWETPSMGSSTVVGLTDRYEELPSQTFSEFAHGGLVAASPTRDIQTAIDATPVGPACQVIVGPGSYSGATVTIPTGRNNIAIIGPTAGDFGGTVVSLSAGRALTIGNNAVRVRVANIQVEGLTTISTTGAGVHRIERCQLVGGLSVGAISATIYVVGCEVGNLSVNAGFTGLLLFDRCQFLGTFTNNTLPTRVLVSDCSGAAAPTTSAVINGRFQTSTGTTVYRDGNAISGAPVTAISGLTPAADRIAYYTSGLSPANTATAAMTALTSFGRSLIDDADAATARTTLGAQASDATLTALAGLTTAANKLPYFTGVDTATVTDITTAGREILSTASSGTSGQVLTSSGGGAPTWTTVSGGGVWTQAGTVLSPTTSGDTVEVPVAAFGSAAISTSEPSGFTTSIAPGQIIASDGIVLEARLDAAGALMALRGDSGGAVVPTIRARDFDDTATTLDLVVGGLTVNGSAGTAGHVLTSNGTGLAPTWQAAGGGGGSGLPTSQSWTIDWRPTSVGYATLAASGWTLVNLTSNGLFADTNGNIYEELVQTGISSIGYFYPTALTVDNTQPWEMEWDIWTSLFDGFCTLQANEGLGAGKYRWRMFYSTTAGTPAGTWQAQGPSGLVSLSTPYDVQTNSRVVMGMQSEPKASRAYYANGACVGLLNPNGCATGDNTNVPGKYLFGNSSTTATAITLRVYGVRVLHGSRGTAPPYARNIWPPVQP